MILGIIAIVLAAGLVLTLLQKTAPANTGNIYVTQASVSASQGAEVRYTLRITPGAAIDTITASAAYDSNDLTFKKAEYTDTPFSSQIPATDKNNVVTVQAAKLGGQTIQTDSFIATLVFTASKSGNHSIDLTDGNAARAGVATHPTVMGKVIEVTPTRATDNTVTSAADTATTPLATFSAPATALLKTLGVSSKTAEKAAPWVMGLITCLLLGVISLIVVLRIRAKKHPKTSNVAQSLTAPSTLQNAHDTLQGENNDQNTASH